MAEKINIEDLMLETYADKSVKAYNDLIAKPDSLFGLGSAAAEAAASAAALALKAVRLRAPTLRRLRTPRRSSRPCAPISCTCWTRKTRQRSPLTSALPRTPVTARSRRPTVPPAA